MDWVPCYCRCGEMACHQSNKKFLFIRSRKIGQKHYVGIDP
ncbi:PCYCGC motif-containing (lipo)protein [Paenibacillus spongiae]